jgi:hypothetical protein
VLDMNRFVMDLIGRVFNGLTCVGCFYYCWMWLNRGFRWFGVEPVMVKLLLDKIEHVRCNKTCLIKFALLRLWVDLWWIWFDLQWTWWDMFWTFWVRLDMGCIWFDLCWIWFDLFTCLDRVDDCLTFIVLATVRLVLGNLTCVRYALIDRARR